MPRKHALVIALLLGAGLIVGVVALARTTLVGRSAHRPTAVSSASVARRSRALNRLERSLNTALAKKPPALPRLPSAGTPITATAPRVAYVRPAPIVVHRRVGGGEHEAGEPEGGDRDE